MDLKKLRKTSQLHVRCGDIDIKSKTSVKYLGVTLEQDLSGNNTGESVIKKVNSGLKFLYRKSAFLGKRERKLICSAFFQSKFDYACNMWYRSISQYIQKKLQTSQNKVIRFILDKEPKYHLECEDFASLGLLNVERRVDYLTLNIMYKIFNCSAPSYMCEYVEQHKRVYNTRYSYNSFTVPQVNSNGKLTFKWNGVKLWNKLPNYIKSCDSKKKFKSQYKKYLFNEMIKVENSIYTK